MSSLMADASSAVGCAGKAFLCSVEEDAGSGVWVEAGTLFADCEEGSNVGKAIRLCKTLK